MAKKKDLPKEEGQEKKVEQKIVYIDDNSTVADMSGIRGRHSDKPKTTGREKVRTFFNVMKKMVLPMLATLLVFTIGYIILLAITGKI